MGQYKDASIRDLVEGINQCYFLPDIQREYVWLSKTSDRKIENLFDSILRGYPIGSFLFWKLKKSDVETSRTAAPSKDKLNFDIYEFIEDFDVENIHNRIKDIARVDSNDLNLVLDGQQRLTSLFIGLRGSRTIKKPRTRNTYEKQYLYLNLKYSPTDDTAEDSYQFEFMSEQCVPARNEDNYWFKVRDIIDIDIIDYREENGLDKEEERILHKLKEAICVHRLISYYEECEKNLDKVLKIFIRVNSGGTKLSYSDLLMSIMTRSFTDDIRTEINNRVDDYNVQGFGCFGRDQILKTALMLIGAKHTFSLKNFNKENITAIDKDWDNIITAMTDAVSLVKDFGYSGYLSSGYIISVIAYYLYKKNKTYRSVSANDKKAMFKFVRDAQITSYFRASLDQQLNHILEGMDYGNVTDFAMFNDNMANMSANKALKVTAAIDDLLTLEYGHPAILPLLQALYPDFDYKDKKFHIDHIYPRSKFKPNKAGGAYIGKQDCIFNLQILESSRNTSKNDTDPDKWLADWDSSEVVKYKDDNFIDQSCTLAWNDFENFETKRREAIRNQLEKIFKEGSIN